MGAKQVRGLTQRLNNRHRADATRRRDRSAPFERELCQHTTHRRTSVLHKDSKKKLPNLNPIPSVNINCYLFPAQLCSSNPAVFRAVSATHPLYGRLAAPSNPMMNGLRPTRDSDATTTSLDSPGSYHGAANHTSSPISRPLFEPRPTPSTTPAHARPTTNGSSAFVFEL